MTHVLFTNLIYVLQLSPQAKPNCDKIENDFQCEQQSPKNLYDPDSELLSYFWKDHWKCKDEDRTDYIVNKEHASHFFHTLIHLYTFVIKDALRERIAFYLKLNRFRKRVVSLDFRTKNVFQSIDLLSQ